LVVGKLSNALREQAAAARGSAWTQAVEKLRSRQMVLEERGTTDRSEPSTRALVSSARDQALLQREDGKRPWLAVVPKGPDDIRRETASERDVRQQIGKHWLF
jgi:hypothetical protein